MKNQLPILLLLIAILTLAACGSASVAEEPNQAEAEAGQEAINVVMNDIYFGDSHDNPSNPPVWTVSSGAEVSVNMDNKGVLEHNWAIVKQGEEVPDLYDETTDQDKLFFNAGVLTGGEEQTVDFIAPSAGEYNVICTVPGHSPVMHGKLVVK